MKIRIILLILSLWITFSDAVVYCKGTKYVNVLAGGLEDPIDGTNYEDMKECTWILASPSPAKYLSISFMRFDLEYAYDYLTITNSGNFSAKLTGYQIPLSFSVPTNGQPITIKFSADQLINFKGFSMVFTFNDCSNNCVNGYCFQGQCQCYTGWTGNSCQIPYCPNNCNGKGNCVSNVCVCSLGWVGGDCSQQDTIHCNGDSVIQATTGNFSDHTPWYQPYKDNQRCSWLIRTGSPGAVTIVTALHQFEWYTDTLYVYDGETVNDPLLSIISMSGFPTGPVVTNRDTGSILIKFSTNAAQAFTGFVALFSRNDLCPNSCSENGYCVEGKCSCVSGKTGIDCSQNQIATPIGFNTTITDQLNDFEWKYYSIFLQIPEGESINRINVRFSKLGYLPENSHSANWKWGGGDLTFLSAYEYLPNLETYQTAVPYWIYPTVFYISYPRSGTYFIGVYAKEAATYTLEVDSPFEIVPPGPSASDPNTVTSTSSGHQDSTMPSKTPQYGLVIGIIVVILSIVMIAALGGAFYYYKKRQSSPTGFLRVDEQGEALQLDLE